MEKKSWKWRKKNSGISRFNFHFKWVWNRIHLHRICTRTHLVVTAAAAATTATTIVSVFYKVDVRTKQNRVLADTKMIAVQTSGIVYAVPCHTMPCALPIFSFLFLNIHWRKSFISDCYQWMLMIRAHAHALTSNDTHYRFGTGIKTITNGPKLMNIGYTL